MKVGFSEVEYTPACGFMPGQFQAYFANGAYTPLLANAAAFESNGNCVILISADHLLFPTPYANAIRQAVADGTGLPVKNILLAATHTHTGPAYDQPCWCSPAEQNTANVVAHRIAQVGIRAYRSMQDGARLAVCTAEETRFSFCRDVVLSDGRIVTNPGSKYTDLVRTCDTPDHTAEIMRVTRDGKTVAILINFANHPDTQSNRRDKYSADWPGFMRMALKKKYGEDVTVLFFNGCCGDVNHYDFLHKTHLTLHNAPDVFPPECIGHGMAESISRALDGITDEVEDEEAVDAIETPITVKRRQITERELAWANGIMERAKTEFLPVWEYQTAETYLRTCHGVPETENFTVTGYRVGPWGMLAMPGEMYTAVGRAIKQGSPFAHTVPVELANGHHGYVIPDHVRENGSYEGRFSSGTTGPGAMDAIVNGGLETLNQLAARCGSRPYNGIVS